MQCNDMHLAYITNTAAKVAAYYAEVFPLKLTDCCGWSRTRLSSLVTSSSTWHAGPKWKHASVGIPTEAYITAVLTREHLRLPGSSLRMYSRSFGDSRCVRSSFKALALINSVGQSPHRLALEQSKALELADARSPAALPIDSAPG